MITRGEGKRAIFREMFAYAMKTQPRNPWLFIFVDGHMGLIWCLTIGGTQQ